MNKILQAVKRAKAGVCAAGLLLAGSIEAQVLTTGSPQVYMTNLPLTGCTTVAAGTTNYITNGVCLVRPGYDIGLWWSFASVTNATTTSNATLTVQFYPNATNPAGNTFTLIRPLSGSITNAANGTNVYTMSFYTNFPANILGGCAAVGVYSVKDGDSVSDLTNNFIRLSHSLIPAPLTQ